MKATCVVAHPDDCVIFALSMIHSVNSVDWNIVYVTYTSQDARAQEITRFWQPRGVATEFLGYVDDWHDIELGQCSFDTDQAEADIDRAIHTADFVLTHDAQGDYGHVHHRWVHDAVTRHHDTVITFAAPGQGTHRFEIEPDCVDLAQLPMHASTIQGFHPGQWRNDYCIPAALSQQLGMA
jgi:LmbE family N-acetylglucosaminyl deacetylase